MRSLWISPAMTERLAGSLLHFVWQGAAIAVVAAVVLRLSSRRSSQWRYAVASGALLAMLAAPVLTFAFYAETGGLALRFVRSLNGVSAAAATEVTERGIAVWTQRIVFVWVIGVIACFARLFGGWLLSRRIVRAATAVVNPIVNGAMDRARSELNFYRPVRLLTYIRIEAPVVIGWLRPAILLPPCALVGLTADQLLAILAHELAHVRRYDFLVNAVQCSVECVLFYHPAVWWISKRIRVERERCCDDLAVRVCRDRLVYAQALIALEKARSSEPALALSAAGDSVTERVRRLLGAQGTTRDWQSVAAALLFVAILAGAGMWQPTVFATPVQSVAPNPPAAARNAAEQAAAPARDSALNALVAIATAQAGARPATPAPQTRQVAQPVIAASREAAREKLGMLRVDYSADSFVKQAGEGDTIAVKTFLAAGMNIDARDAGGFTALMKAAQMRQTETVQALLAQGADPDFAPPIGTALSFAAHNGDIPTMKVLLAGGADANVKFNIDYTALIEAASYHHRDAVVLLLDNKAEIDAKGGPFKTTALIAASCQGQIDIVRILLDRGADVNATGNTSALHCAARAHNVELAKLLLDRGADVNVTTPTNPDNGSPLLFSFYQNGDRDSTAALSATAMLFIDRGADVNVKYPNGSTPLTEAIGLKLPEVVRALLGKGADPNPRLNTGKTVLTFALEGKSPENAAIALMLIEKGSDIDKPDSNGRTPLGMAVSSGLTEVVRALLSKGADPNKPSSGASPLSLANGHNDIRQLLIDAGAR